MADFKTIPELDRKGLREFGLTTGAAVVVIFGLFFPWVLDVDWPLWPWIVAAVFWLFALTAPMLLRPVYKGWMRFGLLAGRVMTPLVLGIVFFVLISPMALIRRLRGNDPMKRTLDSDQETYRVKSAKSRREKLEKPF